MLYDFEVGFDVVLFGQLLQSGTTEVLELHLLLAMSRHSDSGLSRSTAMDRTVEETRLTDDGLCGVGKVSTVSWLACGI